LLQRLNYAAGATHLMPILMLAVHGIDANDSAKTNETLKFFFSVLQWIPLVDESDNEFDPANENDAAGKNKKQKQNTLL
jgi:hypothetical protein